MDMAIHLCHFPSPHHLCGQLRGAGGRVGIGGGKGAFQNTVPELFWAAVNREQGPPLESFSASRGTKVSGARKTDGTVNLREGWGSACVRGCHVGILTVSVS